MLVAHAAAEGDLSPAARARAAELGRALPRPRAAFTSPAPAARRTADALGLSATVADALADRDPTREDVDALAGRVAGWLAAHEHQEGTHAAVTHVAVVRAAVLVALRAPADAYEAIGVAPCSITELGFREGRWHLARLSWEPSLQHIPQRRGRRRAFPSRRS